MATNIIVSIAVVVMGILNAMTTITVTADTITIVMTVITTTVVTIVRVTGIGITAITVVVGNKYLECVWLFYKQHVAFV